MDLHHFPFFSITAGALVVHIVSGIVAVLTGRGWMHEWSKSAQTARLFTVQRRDVPSPISWRMVVLSRTALTVALASFALDLAINA